MVLNIKNHYASLLIWFFIVCSILLNHEMWRDEIHTWLRVGTFDNLLDFIKNRGTDSHPILWQLITYITNKVSNNVIVLQILNLSFVLGSLILIFKYSPFEIAQIILIPFTYYFAFEYPILTRSYSLGIFLLFSTIIFLQKKKDGWAILFSFLAANTNILIAIILFSLSLYLSFSKRFNTKKAVLFVGGIALSMLDIIYQTFVNWNYDFSELIGFSIHKLGLIYRGFIPFPKLDINFWNTNIIETIPNQILSVYLEGFFSFLILFIIFLVFRNNLKLFVSFIIGTVVMTILFSYFWEGSQRHWGHYFLLFLVFYWQHIQDRVSNKVGNYFLTVILCLQVPGAIFANYMDYKYPFSNSGNVASYIKTNFDLGKYKITGVEDFTITPIVANISDSSTFFNIQSNKNESFIDWNRPNSYALNNASIFENIVGVNIGIKLLNFEYLTGTKPPVICERKRKFDGAIVEDENYILYDIKFLEDKSIYKLNNKLLPASCITDTSVIEYFQKDSVFQIGGWTSNQELNSLEEKYLVLESDTIQYLILTSTSYRKDIYKITKNEKDLFARFESFKLKMDELPKGKYDIKLLIIESPEKYCLSDTKLSISN